MDKARLNRRILRNLLTAPWIFFPGAIGLAALSVALVFGSPTGGLAITGMAFLLLGLAGLGSQYLFRGEQLAREAADDLRQQDERQHFERLRGLHRQLRLDRDPRTGTFIQEMRRLYQRLEQACLLDTSRAGDVLPEVRDKAEELYRSCLASLERSLELSVAAQQMATAEARQQVLDARERLLAEIETSIRHLDATLDHLQTAQLRRDDREQSLSQMRTELDMGLAVARRVEARVGELERGVRESTPE